MRTYAWTQCGSKARTHTPAINFRTGRLVLPMVILVLICLTVPDGFTADAQTKKPLRGAKRVETTDARSDGQKSSTAPTDPVPDPKRKRVEFGEGIGHPLASITLAQGSTTIFHCPEEPLQFIVGDDVSLAVAQGDESGAAKYDLYVKALRPNVRTDFVIEMASGTVIVPVNTIAVKGGARVGQYNSEVYVRLPAYKDEIVKLREQVPELQQRAAEAELQAKRASAEAEQRLQEGLKQARERFLADAMYLYESQLMLKPFKARAVQRGKIKLSQLSRAIRDKQGMWWATFKVEGKDSKNPLSLDNIEADGNWKIISMSGGKLPRAVPENSPLVVSLLLEPPAGTTANPVLRISIGTVVLQLPIEQ